MRVLCDSAQPGAGLVLPPFLLDAFLKCVRVRARNVLDLYWPKVLPVLFCSPRGGGGGRGADSALEDARALLPPALPRELRLF